MDQSTIYYHDEELRSSNPSSLDHSLWKSEEIPQVDSILSNSSSPVTTPRSHHKRISAVHGGIIAPTSPINQSSPPKFVDHLAKDHNSGPDLSHRKEMLKKGTRIPLSLLASFDNYDNLKRRRSASLASASKNSALNQSVESVSTPKSISMPSSPFQFNRVDFSSIENSNIDSHYSITVTTSDSNPSSPSVSTPPRPFSKSFSASFLEFRLNSPPSQSKKRPSAVKVETMSPNRSRLKSVLEPSNSSPNLFSKSPSSYQSNVKGLKSKFNSLQITQERDLIQIHDYKAPLFV